MASTPAKDAILVQLRQELRNSWRRTVISFFFVALCLGVLFTIDHSQAPVIKAMVISGAEALLAGAYSLEVLASHHYVAPVAYLAFMFWVKRRQSREVSRLIPQLVADEPDAAEVLAATSCLKKAAENSPRLQPGDERRGATPSYLPWHSQMYRLMTSALTVPAVPT